MHSPSLKAIGNIGSLALVLGQQRPPLVIHNANPLNYSKSHRLCPGGLLPAGAFHLQLGDTMNDRRLCGFHSNGDAGKSMSYRYVDDLTEEVLARDFMRRGGYKRVHVMTKAQLDEPLWDEVCIRVIHRPIKVGLI